MLLAFSCLLEHNRFKGYSRFLGVRELVRTILNLKIVLFHIGKIVKRKPGKFLVPEL